MAAFANMEEDRGRQVDITSAGGNNATRRQGGSAKRWGGGGGGAKEGEKGLFPREGTICRENFKNATPWSVWNEISQRILIRLRPEGRGGSIQIIWPSRPPLPWRRRVSCECRCQGKRTSYVSRADVIHWMKYRGPRVRMPRVIGFDGYLIDGLAAVWYRFIREIRFIGGHWFPCEKLSRNRFIIWTIKIIGFNLVYFLVQ